VGTSTSMTTSANLKDQIESLYVGYFGRAADSAGSSYWTSQIESGAMTLEKVAASFAVQPEALAKYSYLSAPNATSPTDFVNQVYHQLFGHDADAAGLQYWTQQLAAAHGNPQAIGQFIVNVISGATGADDTALKGKIDGPPTVTPATPNTSTSPAPTQPSTHVAPVNDTATDSTASSTAGVLTLAASGLNTGAGVDGVGLTGVLTAGALNAIFLNAGASVQKFIPGGDGSNYFFTMYDMTNSRLIAPAVAEGTSTNSGDTVSLIGSVNMSAADYANIILNHFSVAGA
jgi:hypothetical protein